MRSLAVFVLATSSSALAHADAPEPPVARTDRIEGPFASADAYFAFRLQQQDPGAKPGPCVEVELELEVAPAAPRSGQAIRGYRFVRVAEEVHLAVETPGGWYGKRVATAANGDGVSVDAVRLTDLVGDREAELVFEITSTHEPCGCDDLWRHQTELLACTVVEDALRCTDPIATAVDMHLVDVFSWSSTVTIKRDGRATRKLEATSRMKAKEKRALAVPFRVTFHR